MATRSRIGRGQAVAEFAVVLPLLLLFLLGIPAIGLLVLHRIELKQAANEAAVAVAQEAGDCSVAGARVQQLLGYVADDVECQATGQLAELTVTHSYPTLLPFLPSAITVQSRAVLREVNGPQSPTPSVSSAD